jgi:hydroxymethylpyrimidine/phosphomethylpyrimidine kinase
MKHVLVISGLDPSGGAGFLADARVAADHGVRAVGVVTALTVQDTGGVRSVESAPPDVVGDQLRALLADVEVTAVKIGMLGDERIATVVADALAATRAPVVWDPVLMPTRGGVPLLRGDFRAVFARLLPEARVITPNLVEVETFSGVQIVDVTGMRAAAAGLRAAGAQAVLIKGGHLPPPSDSTDLLDDGGRVLTLTGERLKTPPIHGTGCVLSTALACGLADGQTLAQAASAAKMYLTEKLRNAFVAGRGARCLV